MPKAQTLRLTLDRFFNSSLYPFLFAAAVALSGVSAKTVYLPIIYLLTLTSIASGLLSSDLKVFIVPAFLIYYAIGLDVTPDHYTRYDAMPTFDEKSLVHLIVCLTLLAATLIFRLVRSGAFQKMLTERGFFFRSILLIDVALLANGIFSKTWTPIGFLYGLLSAVVLTLFYTLFLQLFSSSQNAFSYAAKTLVAIAFAASAEILVIAYRLHQNGNLYLGDVGKEYLNRMVLSLSWGLPTIIGAVIALGIPAALYLARSHRFPILSVASAAFFFGVTVFIDTRSAIVFGGITLILGTVFCSLGGQNKKPIRALTLSLVTLAALSLLFLILFRRDLLSALTERILVLLRFKSNKEEITFLQVLFGDRLEFFKRGIADFAKAPLFGSGFLSGDYEASDVYNYMYHNVLLEFLGSMGLVGIFAFLVHVKHLLEIIIRRFTPEKLLFLLIPLLILAMSLVDNFFFYPNFTILYAAFLAAAELLLEKTRRDKLSDFNRPKKGEKPRVVFTFIEAGKGHIVPTRTVCNAFKAKYGDRVEVIESAFFTETGDPDMEKTEILFTETVKNQNRTPIMSLLCKLGNLLAGDTFALEFLLSKTKSGRKTAPLAIRHMEELNAHLVYTAHWATPYYINKMKTPRPYTVCFCPDVYSNGAFNVDCNNFLISSEAGAKEVLSYRMYAGGNITKIPFPSRPEIKGLRDTDKIALRRKLALPENTFTVSLSDGGYGMARLGKTVEALVALADTPITVIALCGTNTELLDKLEKLNSDAPNPNVTLVPLGFTDKITAYVAASDLYAGKSGANSISEPASLGVPIIVTKCITYIERGIKHYYVKDLKGAIYLPSAKRAAEKIIAFAKAPDQLVPFQENLAKAPDTLYNAEASADLLYERLVELGYLT